MKLKSILFIIIAGITFASCNHKPQNEEISTEEDHFIVISYAQFETDEMIFGELQKMPFQEIVKCNGHVEAKSTGIAKVSPAITSLVKKVSISTGQKVNVGQVLFELSGNDFIELQQNFMESANQLKRLKSEYERIKSLYKEKVGTEKEMISAESDYKNVNAKYSALKKKLQFLGLDPAKIEETGFYNSFFIRSPISGYISKIHGSIGQYADQQTCLAEIIDVNQLHLQLSVFEKDINKLHPDQKIKFQLSDNSNRTYDATLKSIGRTIDTNTKSIQCYADIKDLQSANFIKDAYIEAEICTKTDTVNAITEEATVKMEGEYFILVLEKDDGENYFLRRIKVDIGRFNKGYVEVLEQSEYPKILTKGAFNINN